MRSFAWRTTSVGPGYLRDVFSGQVLALHPLSGFFMNDPGLMAVAGRFFACDAFDRVMAGRPGDCPEYWAFVGAVLDAAGMYGWPPRSRPRGVASDAAASGRRISRRSARMAASCALGVAAPVARLRPPSGEDPPDPPSTGPPPGGMRRGRPRPAGPPPIAPARAELVPDFGPCSDRRR